MPGATEPGDGDARPGLGPAGGIALTLAGLALCAVAVATIEPLRDAVGEALRGNSEDLRAEVRDLGAGGAALVLALTLVHVFVWYPAEIVDAAAGFAYDFWLALPLVMGGWVLSALVAHWIGRRAARPLLYRLTGERRFREVEGAIERGGTTLLLAVRLIPIVPFSLTNFVAGAARVPLGRFIWTTTVGFLPITALFVYLGSRLDSLSITDPVLLGGAALLIALLVVGRRMLGGRGAHGASGARPARAPNRGG